MHRNLAALLSGLLFGLGLALSGMTDRHKVLGFLDVAGDWDPTLVFVMGGAVLVTLVTFRFVLRRPQPVLEETFHLPSKKQVDGPLIMGAVLFGMGWGLAGFCPGPALASLTALTLNPFVFCVALVAGSFAAKSLSR
jgi:uncharacterized protein